MDSLLAALHLEPLPALLVAFCVVLYIDARKDRERFHKTLEEFTEALTSIKSELALIAQTVTNIMRRTDHQ